MTSIRIHDSDSYFRCVYNRSSPLFWFIKGINCLLLISAFVLLIFGTICLVNGNNISQTNALCGSQTGGLIMFIIGTVIIGLNLIFCIILLLFYGLNFGNRTNNTPPPVISNNSSIPTKVDFQIQPNS